ncbi:MAG: Gldg family protein, partial [Planctomycetota bacterium]|nr:Gldg family protein [Planctomycetota bacterium]
FKLGQTQQDNEAKREKDGSTKRVWTKDRSKQISIRDMFQVSLMTGSTKPIFKGEEQFTNAILEMQGETKPKIYFFQGHNELAFADNKTERAAGGVVDFLKTRFFEVLPLRLEGAAGIPKDCAVLVIAGAREPLSGSDLSALRAYVKTGGRVLAYDEALMAANDGLKPSPLEDFLLDFNIETSRHLVFAEFGVQRGDQRMQVQTVNNIPLTAFDVNHPVVKPLAGGRLVSYGARALTVNGKNKNAKSVSLVNSSPKGFVAIKNPRDFKRRNGVIREEDMKGSFSLAAASEMKLEGAKRSRVIVTGDADLMTNQGLGQGKNVEFFLNSLNWLLEKEGRFVAEAKTPPTWSLEIDPGTKIMFQLGALFILPILPLSIGLLMFLLRRR